MRLDKYISKALLLSRKAATEKIRSGNVTVNGKTVKSSDAQVSENDVIAADGKTAVYSEYVYLMMNKPAGVLSATEDGKGQTVLDLLSQKYQNKGIFPVGRLDKDTVGLLILTNDGQLAHGLLSPKHHVGKSYYLESEYPLSDEDVKKLCDGVMIDAETKTLPAKISKISDRAFVITVCEGKFHQIKRMLEAVENKVTFLERIKFGGIELDRTLDRGQWRELTEKEIKILKGSDSF